MELSTHSCLAQLEMVKEFETICIIHQSAKADKKFLESYFDLQSRK